MPCSTLPLLIIVLNILLVYIKRGAEKHLRKWDFAFLKRQDKFVYKLGSLIDGLNWLTPFLATCRVTRAGPLYGLVLKCLFLYFNQYFKDKLCFIYMLMVLNSTRKKIKGISCHSLSNVQHEVF
jgi:hypothetical protein